MSIFSRKPKSGGLMDEIRCDETSYLIWKWHPMGTQVGSNKRENAIRWGSSLRVREGSVAVFVYTQEDGTRQEFIEGPFDGIIETENFPVLASIIGLAYQGGTPFQAEVYFINLAQLIQLKFAVPYFDVYDPRFLDYGVPTAVRGTISFRIADYREFIKLHRLDTFTMYDFQSQVRDAVSRYVKSVVANAPEQEGIPVVQLERRLDQINDMVETRIRGRLSREFGVTVSSVDIAVIDIDKTSEEYQQLKAVTKDLATATMQARNEVESREMRDNQRLGILERAGRAFVDIREGAYARRKQTQSANLAAYQIEAQEHVGVAGAHGLGMMGAAANKGGGMNPAAMVAGMRIGDAVGQNIAGDINTVMAGAYQQAAAQQEPAPAIPTEGYMVAVGGNPTGPFDIATLGKMASAGELTRDSLVWKRGMNAWARASDVAELASLFFDEMPPIPNDDGMPPIPMQ